MARARMSAIGSFLLLTLMYTFIAVIVHRQNCFGTFVMLNLRYDMTSWSKDVVYTGISRIYAVNII